MQLDVCRSRLWLALPQLDSGNGPHVVVVIVDVSSDRLCGHDVVDAVEIVEVLRRTANDKRGFQTLEVHDGLALKLRSGRQAVITPRSHRQSALWDGGPIAGVLMLSILYVPLVTLGLILLVLGGWSMVLWGNFVRVVVGLHGTWLVNSATHMWGTHRFETHDDSRNSWWVALLTFGEGWHNNHHAHPVSARHGLAWYEFDISWITLKFFNAIGIVSDLKVAKVREPMPVEEAA